MMYMVSFDKYYTNKCIEEKVISLSFSSLPAEEFVLSDFIKDRVCELYPEYIHKELTIQNYNLEDAYTVFTYDTRYTIKVRFIKVEGSFSL